MPDFIDTLLALDDAALTAKLGYKDKVADFKKDLEKAAALDDKARPLAADKIKRMFEPNIYPDDIGWKIREAEREAKPKTAADCMCDNSPSSIMDDD